MLALVLLAAATIVQDFESGSAGWAFHSVGEYAAPSAFHAAEALQLVPREAGDSFGFWQSPRFRLVRSADEPTSGAIPLLIPADRRTLLSARFRVRCDASDPALAPEIRLRATTTDSQQADMMVIASSGAGGFSPGPDGREYELLTCPAPGSPEFQLEFEVLDFDPTDAAAAVALESIVLQPVELDRFAGSRLEADYFFSDFDVDGFRFSGVPEYTEPDLVVDFDVGAIGFAPHRTAEEFEFGWWGSPEDAARRIPIDSGRLYYATFGIVSDIADRRLVPSFRCRLNESGMRAAGLVHVASTAAADNVPGPGEQARYCAFLPPGAPSDGYLVVSFDFLSGPVDGDAADGFVGLDRVRIESVPWP